MAKRSSDALVVAAVAGGVVVAVGVVAVVRAVRRRRRRVLTKSVRKAVTEIIELRADDLVPEGAPGTPERLLRHLDRLNDKQLIALFALAQVGHFVKTADIDPRHPSKDDIAAAVRTYVSSELKAPATRDVLVRTLTAGAPGHLGSTLAAALGVLGNA